MSDIKTLLFYSFFGLIIALFALSDMRAGKKSKRSACKQYPQQLQIIELRISERRTALKGLLSQLDYHPLDQETFPKAVRCDMTAKTEMLCEEEGKKQFKSLRKAYQSEMRSLTLMERDQQRLSALLAACPKPSSSPALKAP